MPEQIKKERKTNIYRDSKIAHFWKGKVLNEEEFSKMFKYIHVKSNPCIISLICASVSKKLMGLSTINETAHFKSTVLVIYFEGTF